MEAATTEAAARVAASEGSLVEAMVEVMVEAATEVTDIGHGVCSTLLHRPHRHQQVRCCRKGTSQAPVGAQSLCTSYPCAASRRSANRTDIMPGSLSAVTQYPSRPMYTVGAAGGGCVELGTVAAATAAATGAAEVETEVATEAGVEAGAKAGAAARAEAAKAAAIEGRVDVVEAPTEAEVVLVAAR